MNTRGDVLISRDFRGDIGKRIAVPFRLSVVHSKNPPRSPVVTLQNATYMHLREGNIYVVAVTRSNANAALVFEVLHTLINLLRSFAGKIDENVLAANFVLIYELLDEVLDFGYPQACGVEALALTITQGKMGKLLARGGAATAAKRTQEVTGAVSWRSADVRHKKNEVFIDVIESVTMMVSPKGTLLHADVKGQVLVRAQLSGMPECRFGINDRLMIEAETQQGYRTQLRAAAIAIDDCHFHQCVRLGHFDAERAISFIPPEGEFELLSYRISENVNLPFRVIPVIREVGSSKVEMQISLRSLYGGKITATSVFVKIPTPPNTALAKIHTAHGKAKYRPQHNAILWRLKKYPAATESQIDIVLDLTPQLNNEGKWVRQPIALQFVVPMFTASGIHVRFLKVVESRLNYTPIKWVRYITKAQSYQVRV